MDEAEARNEKEKESPFETSLGLVGLRMSPRPYSHLVSAHRL